MRGWRRAFMAASAAAAIAAIGFAQQPSERLMLSDQIIGSEVRNQAGETLGTIEQFIMEPKSGDAQFVVVDVGGILGFREREIAVPYELLTVVDKNTLRMDMTLEKLKRAPVFDENQWLVMSDRTEWKNEIREYFGLEKETDSPSEAEL